MIGIDLSHWQDGIDLSKSAGHFQFGIVKATESHDITDRMMVTWTEQLTKLNKLIGYYHFARPDIHNSIKGMKDEARNFCEAVKSIDMIEKAILIIDWEVGPLGDVDLLRAITEEVVVETGITPFIYGSQSTLMLPSIYDYVKQFPIWVAKWVSVNTVDIDKAHETVLPNLNQIYIPYKIWQFSSHGRLVGSDLNVDINYSPITDDSWLKLTKPMKLSTKENLSDDMVWAIEQGIFKGHTDGTYRPADPLTREQAASLLRRLYDICMGDFWDAVETYEKNK